jgi:hypothetical protein
MYYPKPRDRLPSGLKIGEAGSVQFAMVDHATGIGWVPVAPHEALYRRCGEANGCAHHGRVLKTLMSAYVPGSQGVEASRRLKG